MTADLRRAAEHLAAGPNGREFLAGVVWPVAVREWPQGPWTWLAEQLGFGNGADDLGRHETDTIRWIRAGQEKAARLLLCRVPRSDADIAAIEAATGARNLEGLLRACGAESVNA